MTKEKKMEKTNAKDSATATAVPTFNEVRFTPIDFAKKLMDEGSFEFTPETKLVIEGIDSSDLMKAINAVDNPKRLQVFLEIMNKFSLSLNMEGSLSLGEFDVGSHSWAMTAGESGALKIKATPATVVKSVSEMVSFLNLVTPGKGFPLKAHQSLLLTGMSSTAMMDYYKLCENTQDTAERENGQDKMFKQVSELLQAKGLNLRIYGLNASQVNRSIDMNAGGILFQPVEQNDGTKPHLILTLLADSAK